VTAQGRVLGVDLGSRRIGVAVTDSAQRVATGVATVRRSGDRSADHTALARLVADYEAVQVVVGLPVSLSGDLGPAARAVLEEVGEIRGALDVEVATVDERFTTVSATAGMAKTGRRQRERRGLVDQAAAAELLQTWVDSHRTGKGGRA
jgi:putative holliday junction resolvase